jgi:iturin family lipopeptide synthetase A
MVAAIWQDLLGIDRIGVNDNFFELGGHSLLATRLMSRLREAFQVEIPLRSLFEAVTIADSAAMLLEHQVGQADATALEEILAEIRQLGEQEMQAVLAAERQLIKEEILNE